MSFAEQLARLQVFLDADDLHEEALDYIAAHGYLTALCICSEQVPEREWIDALFSEPPKYKDDTEREAIEATLVQLKAHIARQLASDGVRKMLLTMPSAAAARRREGKEATHRLPSTSKRAPVDASDADYVLSLCDLNSNGVLDRDASQEDVFERVAQPVIESVMSGFNGTIFAYGQTGSGKS